MSALMFTRYHAQIHLFFAALFQYSPVRLHSLHLIDEKARCGTFGGFEKENGPILFKLPVTHASTVVNGTFLLIFLSTARSPASAQPLNSSPLPACAPDVITVDSPKLRGKLELAHT